MTATDIAAIAPLAVVAALAMLVIVIDMAWPGRDRLVTAASVVGLAVAVAVTVLVWRSEPQEAFGGTYVRDDLTGYLDLLFLSIALLTILFAPEYLRPRGLPMAEFASTLLFAISGAMLLGGAEDLLVLFLGLELLVLPGYMLAGFAKRDGLSTEGAIKYFLLGSFSSAILLFGMALTWGYTATTRVDEIAIYLESVAAGTRNLSPALVMGLALLTTGVAFKIAAVPFHYWTPDAYQGSPTPVTGYLSVGPKVAAFALILRLFAEALAPVKGDWVAIVVILAALTMTLGNLVALTQDNIKRMLAYSSIAHTGYILVGLAAFAGSPEGSSAEQAGLFGLLFYSLAYAFMNLGAFAVVAALQRRPGVTSQISSFAGLARRDLPLTLLMTLFLLSLVGIPPLAGFFAKFYVIEAAIEAGTTALAVLAVLTMLNAAAAAFYYLRVVLVMWVQEPSANAPGIATGRAMGAGLAVSAVLTVVIGFIPPLIDVTQRAAGALLAPL